MYTAHLFPACLSPRPLFRDCELFPSMDPHFYQCSRRTTSVEVETVFQRAVKRQAGFNELRIPINCGEGVHTHCTCVYVIVSQTRGQSTYVCTFKRYLCLIPYSFRVVWVLNLWQLPSLLPHSLFWFPSLSCVHGWGRTSRREPRVTEGRLHCCWSAGNLIKTLTYVTAAEEHCAKTMQSWTWCAVSYLYINPACTIPDKLCAWSSFLSRVGPAQVPRQQGGLLCGHHQPPLGCSQDQQGSQPLQSQLQLREFNVV